MKNVTDLSGVNFQEKNPGPDLPYRRIMSGPRGPDYTIFSSPSYPSKYFLNFFSTTVWTMDLLQRHLEQREEVFFLIENGSESPSEKSEIRS